MTAVRDVMRGVRPFTQPKDSRNMRRLAAALVMCLTALTLRANAQPGCTQETLLVRGTPVTVGYCVAGAPRSDGDDEVVVPITATYGSPAGAFSQPLELHFVAGEGSTRILQSLRLARLGMPGVLHLTLLYAGGLVRVEGAMLTPGAITVK